MCFHPISRKAKEVYQNNPDWNAVQVADFLYEESEIRDNYTYSTVYNLCKPSRLPSDADDSIQEVSKPYLFDKPNKRYILNSPFRKNILVVPESLHLEILNDYSNFDGAEKTIKDMALKYEMRVEEMSWYLKTFNHSHGSLPVSDEMLDDMNEDEVANYLKDLKKKRALDKLKQEEQRDNDKLIEIAKGKSIIAEVVGETLGEFLSSDFNQKAFEAVTQYTYNTPRPIDFLRLDVINIFDRHVGYAPLEGEDESWVPYISEMMKSTNSGHGLLVFGGDFFHVDNTKNTTVSGTQLTVSKSAPDLIRAAYQEAYRILKLAMLRYPGRLRVVVLDGNHDASMSYGLLFSLQETLKCLKERPFEVISNGETLTVTSFGDNMLAFEHGDGPKGVRINDVLSGEYRELWGKTKFTYLHKGHLHHVNDVEIGPVLHQQNPSAVRADGYHSKNGFFGTPALRLHTYHHEAGLCNIIHKNIIRDSK